jgi:hypothetical protein
MYTYNYNVLSFYLSISIPIKNDLLIHCIVAAPNYVFQSFSNTDKRDEYFT